MSDAPPDNAARNQVPNPTRLSSERSATDDTISSLRGAAPGTIGRTFWLLAATVGLAVFAVVLVVNFLSVASDNSRIDRMKSHGISVNVTVTGCIGNIGGSGSNVSGYTCRGDYSLGGITYHEVIGSLSTLAASGTTVQGTVDPTRHSTVELSSAVKSSKVSSSGYVAPGLLSIVLVGLALALVRVTRTNRRSTSNSKATPGSDSAKNGP